MLRSSPACPNFTRSEPIQLHDRLELGAVGWRCHARHAVRYHSTTAAPSYLSHKRGLVLVERRVADFASVEHPQHVGYEEDQQYGAQPYARTPTITPAAMAVVPSTAPDRKS